MPSQASKASLFRRLHHRRQLFVLPNAWDVPSARLFEDAGFPAVATSSTALMTSLGYPDGETIPKRALLAAIRRISGSLSVPFSADIVAGFGRNPRGVAETVRSVIDAGAVGVNIEDVDPRTNRLISLPEQVRRLQAAREAAGASGVPLVINARTVALRYAEGDAHARLEETIRRSIAYRDAGADCVYPTWLIDPTEISTFVRRVQGPVNVQVRPGLPPLRKLESLGIRRVSFGPSAIYATLGLLKRVCEEIRTQGTFTRLTEGVIDYEAIHKLVLPRGQRSKP